MSDQDIAPDAPVETVEAPQDVKPSPEAEAETPKEQDTVENEAEVEEPEETVEQKIERLESQAKKAADAKKKINAQRKHIASLQKAADERARQLQELQSQQQSAEVSGEPQKPTVDDFETYQDYEEAQSKYVDELASYKAKEVLNKERQELLQREAQEAHEKAQRERNIQYETQKKEFLEVAPDYVDSEAEFNDYIQQAMQVTDPYVQSAVVEQVYSEEGVSAPAVIHYFGANGGENIGELEAISKLSPTKAAVEIYKIQQKLKSSPTKREKSEPLPKPPKKVSGGGSKSKTTSKMSGEELLNWAKG